VFENLEIFPYGAQMKSVVLFPCISAALMKAVIVADPMPFWHTVMFCLFTKENQKTAEYYRY